ncbi:MAG: flagellar hook protein FlgE [Acetobacteraceae bacterium]
MSSLFGALDTAVTGLGAQSSAFGNISDNIANSQTTGFKAIDTNFQDFLTTSTASVNDSGSVATTPGYENSVQGTITTSTNLNALAISGQGFFQVSQEIATSSTGDTFSPLTEYSRDGNFSVDNNGFLANDSGQILNGWSVNPTTGAVDQNTLQPIQINQTAFAPQATQTVTLSANLPATPDTSASASPISSQINVFDGEGTQHAVDLGWAPVSGSTNTWTVTITSPDDPALNSSATVVFGDGTTPGVPAGTIASITGISGGTPDTSTTSTTTGTAQSPATLGFTATFNGVQQPITLNLGTVGGDNGLTQFAGTTYSLRGLTSDGVAPGSYTGYSIESSGAVVLNYNNGETRTIAQVPIVQFANPDGLQRQNGQAYTATTASGAALAQAAGTGAGSLVTGSIEASNVDIATEFSKLIVAQQAYSANAKMVTTADQMLQTTIDMKQ